MSMQEFIEKYNGKILTTTEEVLKFDRRLEKAMRMSLPEDVCRTTIRYNS